MQQTIELSNRQLAALGEALRAGRLSQAEYRARRRALLQGMSCERGSQEATVTSGPAIEPYDSGTRPAPRLPSRLSSERGVEALGLWLARQALLPLAFVALLVILLILWVG